MSRKLLLLLSLILLPAAAEAISVTNLDKQNHQVLAVSGNQQRAYDVAPDQTVYIEGADLRIHLEGRTEIRTFPNDRYTIWPGPFLYIQQPGNVMKAGNRR